MSLFHRIRSQHFHDLPSGPEIALNRMLSSWKEIAHFFGKGVRTVQRWEKTLNLPIRRPPGAPSNVVLARTSDLEAWMHRGPGKAALAEEAVPAMPLDQITDAILTDLEQEVHLLIRRTGAKVVPAEVPEAGGSERLQRLLDEVKAATSQSAHQLRKVA